MQPKHRTAPQEEAALEALTGLSAEEVRRGQATGQAAARRAEAIQVRKTPSWPKSWANFSLF